MKSFQPNYIPSSAAVVMVGLPTVVITQVTYLKKKVEDEEMMCSYNVAADRIAIRCWTPPGGLLEVPVVVANNPYTAMIHGLLYLFDCYDEDSGEYQKPNLSHVELDTQLKLVNCVDNLGGNKESLASLVRMVMEYDLMFIFQILTLEEKREIGFTIIVVLLCVASTSRVGYWYRTYALPGNYRTYYSPGSSRFLKLRQ
eukprot:scaffold168975_cov32-Attheya_sp.AAC.2